ncbi:SWIM-type domain-containing protein [Favolaschia claudopus]|uniref:SWIM-type domain-containing protein n=1 Tax=Favolaschia claudopus TaxID=2862362 RepID=A0AAW0C694_9AGAR
MAGTIREAALDSTCKNYFFSFELSRLTRPKPVMNGFALLGEVFGSGLPVGFLFIKTSSPDPNQKEKYIRSFIRNLLDKWNLDVIQSLSDKDMTEINALLAELPDDIKHQVCFWHSIRIVRGRLSVLAPFREFDWIDRDFLPIGQLDPELQTPVCPCSSQTSPQSAAAASVHRLSGNPDSDANLERLVDSFDDDEEDVSEDLSAEDRIDGPKSWFEPGETPTSSAPAVHRAQLLRIFIRHFCEHPLLPDRSGNLRSAKQIRDAAVFEMYKFCEQRGLREVWAYMWTAWYCPSKYKLMARASQPDFIGRWRTTMSVENFWRNLKHGTLHHLLHPRLDQLVYLIATEVLPSFEAKMQNFDPDFRKGRSKALTPFQKQFKKGWKTLESRALGQRTYQTDLSRWTCSCGQQNPSRPPDPAFFRTVVRRRVIPFYSHPLLIPKDGSVIDPLTGDGSVTDGDDRKRAAVATAESVTEYIYQRIKDLEKGIAILREQADHACHDNRVWLRSMKSHNIGGDVAQMVKDVRHVTDTARETRATTWPQGSKQSARYTRNTMGYKVL